jgi:F-type H+-transporting ATPase subunit b
MSNLSSAVASEPPQVLATSEDEVTGHVGADAGKHIEPVALGLAPYQWVAVSMALLLAIAFIYGKVHKKIAGGLDARIADIREQLDEAKKLRAEAEELREEYAAKIAGAEKDAEAMLDNARREAEGIVSRAEADSAATISRREAMAQDKIAAAERAAVDEVRARAANAATAASRNLIAEKHGADEDRKLADDIIAGI